MFGYGGCGYGAVTDMVVVALVVDLLYSLYCLFC